MRSPLVALALLLTLTACGVSALSSAPPGPTEDAAVQSPSPVLASATTTQEPTSVPPPSATPTATPMPLPTQQARRRCDPGVESCILSWPFPLQRPIRPPGMQQSDPSYRYGTTQDGAREPHHGVDLGNAFGTPVYAAADGEVVFAGNDSAEPVSPWKNFYGDVVVIEHALPGLSAPVFTLYGHLSAVDTSVGETVRAGDKIGEVGASGVALGSHLHFEVRVGTNDYASTHNPELWLAPAPPANAGERDATGGTLAVRAVDSHGNLVPLTLDVQYFAEPSGPVTKTFPVEAYDKKEKFPINSDDVLGENFVLGSLPPGRYRLSFVYWGVLYERWMDVAPGELTFAEFALQ